jgi:hypothetical protein
MMIVCTQISSLKNQTGMLMKIYGWLVLFFTLVWTVNDTCGQSNRFWLQGSIGKETPLWLFGKTRATQVQIAFSWQKKLLLAWLKQPIYYTPRLVLNRFGANPQVRYRPRNGKPKFWRQFARSATWGAGVEPVNFEIRAKVGWLNLYWQFPRAGIHWFAKEIPIEMSTRHQFSYGFSLGNEFKAGSYIVKLGLTFYHLSNARLWTKKQVPGSQFFNEHKAQINWLGVETAFTL